MNTLQTPAVTYLRDRYARREIGPARRKQLETILRGFAHSYGNRPLSHLGPSAVERWLETVGHLAPSSRRLAFGAVRGFLRWLVREGLLPADPTVGVARIRQPRTVPRATSTEDAQRLLASLPDNRARAVVLLEYAMGLRRVEVTRLTLADYDPHAATLRVVGKGGHERLLPVPRAVRRALDAYLGEVGVRSGPLIRSKREPWKGLTPHTVGLLVAEWMRDAGVKQRGVAGHALRHAAASDVLDRCGDLRVVQEMLGHANLSTTSIYLRRAQLGRMRVAMDPEAKEEAEAA